MRVFVVAVLRSSDGATAGKKHRLPNRSGCCRGGCRSRSFSKCTELEKGARLSERSSFRLFGCGCGHGGLVDSFVRVGAAPSFCSLLARELVVVPSAPRALTSSEYSGTRRCCVVGSSSVRLSGRCGRQGAVPAPPTAPCLPAAVRTSRPRYRYGTVPVLTRSITTKHQMTDTAERPTASRCSLGR